MSDNPNAWIGVDLDRTLAEYDEWRGIEHIGEPIPLMLDRVLLWLEEGKNVKIFTARAATPEAIPYIEAWCEEHIGQILPVTNVKDPDMIELWDDLAIKVEENTGVIISGESLMDNKVVIRYNQVTLEAAQFSVLKLTTEVAKNLQTYLVGITDFIVNKQQQIAGGVRFDFANNTSTTKLVEKANYIAITPIEIYVPSGMNSNMVVYLKTLKETQGFLASLKESVITPAKAYFEKLLGTPEVMSTVLTETLTDSIKAYKAGLEKTTYATAACYSKHGGGNKRRHGDVFKRNAEWSESCSLLEDINGGFNRYSPSMLSNDVQDICGVLDRLALRMKQSPETYLPTGIVSNDIADITLLLGQIVEIYAAFTFILQSANAAMKDNQLKYNEVLK